MDDKQYDEARAVFDKALKRTSPKAYGLIISTVKRIIGTIKRIISTVKRIISTEYR
jgi:hypothetical protein